MNVLPWNNKVYIEAKQIDQYGWYSFKDCKYVEAIEVEEGHPHLYSRNNCLLEKGKNKLLLACKNSILPANIRYISYPSFTGKQGLGDIELPYAVEVIDSAAFKECDIKSITLSESLIRIGGNAFEKCAELASVNFSPYLEKIGDCAFSNCTSLKSIHLPDSVKKIGYGAFCGCTDLETVHLPNGLVRIQCETFGNCKHLKTLIIPDSVESIESTAFRGCNALEYIKLPRGIERIREGTFRQCEQLKVVEIPYGVREIKSHAFFGCDSLRSIYIPSSVTKIAGDAFSYEGFKGYSLTIYGSEGSYAQQYAKKRKCAFVAIEEENTFPLVCPDCGTEFVKKANYCHHCGYKIAEARL